MDTFNIAGQEYYLANDLRPSYPKLFVGCQKSMPKLIERHGLGENDYIWARLVGGEYKAHIGKISSKVDKLMLATKWLHNSNFYESRNVAADDKRKYEVLPELLELTDEERIYDNDGNYYNIEVRGKRNHKDIYFKSRDVAKMLGKEPTYLKNALTNKERNYVRDEDYKVFRVKDSDIKQLFLTYKGLLKVIFRSKKCDGNLVDDVLNSSFITQFGTVGQKAGLIEGIIKNDTKLFKQVFSKFTTNMSCIYLISLGQVYGLRTQFNLGPEHDDTDEVFKWGRTNCIERRLYEHSRNYGEIGCKINVKYFTFIDEGNLIRAEKALKYRLNDLGVNIKHNKYRELSVIPRSKIEMVELIYKSIMEEVKSDKTGVDMEIKYITLVTEKEISNHRVGIYGGQEFDTCWFNVKELSDVYNVDLESVIKSDSLYIKGDDYDTFKVVDSDIGLFINYFGMMKIVFGEGICKSFYDCMVKVVFATHLGTKAQKQALAGQLLGVDRQTVRAVFNKSTTEQSCIYLIYLGKASELAPYLGIKATEGDVYKYGRAISLSKRLDQHQAHYGKLTGCDMKLTKYAPIDPIYNVDAENDIKDFFIENEYKLDNKKYVELVILDKPGLKMAKAKYREISDKYMGHYSELNNKIKVLEEKCRADVAVIEAQKNNILAQKNALESELLRQKLKYKKKLKNARRQSA